MVRSTAALLLLLLLLCVRPAAADQSRIAVLQPDEELMRAVSLALSAWGLETLRSEASLPSSTAPETVQMAAHLAHQLDVEALVWVTHWEHGSLIWVFDAATGDVTMRRLTESAPFDSAAAAAVALSVKTALRNTAIAPPGERLVWPEPPVEKVVAPPKVLPVSRPAAGVELGAQGRRLGDDAFALELRLLGSVWFGAPRDLGLGLGFSSGPGVAIEDAAYRGRYRDSTVFARGLYRPLQTTLLVTCVAFGGALHWTMLDGTLLEDASEGASRRTYGSLDLETSIAAKVGGPFYFGAAFGGSYSLAYPRYLVGGRPVFAPSALSAFVGAFSGVALF